MLLSPDGKSIVSGSQDHTLKIWDINAGIEVMTLKGHSKPIKCCSFSSDGRFIISGSDDKTLKLWGASTGADYLR